MTRKYDIQLHREEREGAVWWHLVVGGDPAVSAMEPESAGAWTPAVALRLLMERV